MTLRYLAFLLLIVPAIASTHGEQIPLTQPPTGPAGSLRRFKAANPQELEHIIEIAQNNELDIWQISPSSHVDIYTSANSTVLPESLLQYTQTTSPIPLPNQPELRVKSLFGQAFHSKNVAPFFSWGLGNITNSTFHDSYHPAFEIDAFMYELRELYPDWVTVVQLGHTGEQREMIGLHISKPDVPSQHTRNMGKGKNKEEKELTNKMGFVITGAQHAREWVATASALYLAHALVSDVSEPYSLHALLDSYDFHIIPIPNPDGYAYTWETDRFWYKNRMKTHSHAKCVGLDMNRNWGYKWKRTARGGQFMEDVEDVKTNAKEPIDPCSHWYPGRRPFQAPEVNNIANYISTLPHLQAFVDLRSYGQMLSSPFSYSCKRAAKDAENLLEAALGATHALKMAHGTQFQAGDLCSLLYRAPGNIVDWMYASAGIRYSYAAHMRDTGTYGYALPPKWIRPTGEETSSMIKYLADFVKRKAG